ncbi:succinate dehydrogenase cytochrome b558 subunit [Paenibacillus turpanensis]|uniref:succinate dehydrogenase cytochrome b558 subunit n=1 Tax=Paenibacillus turpanensis TaxID=2689078 RepID=UPI00140CE59D|nr:succinate dehydrogenase cytochrome b558 subunit [Paenibacillus turpanensis]
MKGNSYFYRKLHSLLGVIPLGFFIVEHLITNYAAHQRGAEGFYEAVEKLHHLPLILVLEIVGIWLPLLYHGVYGLYVAYTSNANVNRYSYFRNMMFTLQRVTGVITLVFVAWHFWQTRMQIALGQVAQEEVGSVIHSVATSPLMFTIYVIGIVAAVFHFCNGMWSFLVAWGVTVGPRAQRVSSYIWMTLFVVMSVMFILSLRAFADEEFAHTAFNTVQTAVAYLQ